MEKKQAKPLEQARRENQMHILRKSGKLSVSTVNNQPSKTQQQFKEQTDINNIMKKYQMRHLPNPQAGIYLDSTDAPTYQQSLETVIKANEAFSSLSSDVRKRFSNDPTELLKFLKDLKNTEEAIKLGLAQKKQTEIKTDTKTNDKLNDDKNISENKT